MAFITLTPENVMSEHLCCAIADKKHQTGVNDKRNWLAERIKEGHVFRKLDAQGKVFIEYAPLEKAWVPVTGDNYFYICGWSVKNNLKNKNCLYRASGCSIVQAVFVFIAGRTGKIIKKISKVGKGTRTQTVR